MIPRHHDLALPARRLRQERGFVKPVFFQCCLHMLRNLPRIFHMRQLQLDNPLQPLIGLFCQDSGFLGIGVGAIGRGWTGYRSSLSCGCESSLRLGGRVGLEAVGRIECCFLSWKQLHSPAKACATGEDTVRHRKIYCDSAG